MKLKRNDLTLLLKKFLQKIPNINEMLLFCTENKCSDLWVKVGEQPYVSRYGSIYRVPSFEVTNKIWNEWAEYAISSELNSKYVRNKMLDFSYVIYNEDKEYRYRVSAGFSTNKNIATFRMISLEPPSFSNIDFPLDIAKLLKNIARNRSKITLLVGATGSGKSIIWSHKLFIYRNGILKRVTWEKLKVGDRFIDGSECLEIMQWEFRPCYTLRVNDETICVSDEHLLKCYVGSKDRKILPFIRINNEIEMLWATASDIYEYFKENNVFLYSEVENRWNKLDDIQLYELGYPQKCRCIKTDTGHYQIGPFLNHNTTTLAACINDFSKDGGPFENGVIISLEDPIEYIYQSSDHVKIIQKELGIDFKEYANGIKQALREHPNFVNVGETRDKETINALIEASRTGHAVYSSFHAIDVADTISRLYNQSCSDGNNDIMYDLISNMNVIICQRIYPSGDRFKLDTQYLIFTQEIIQYLNEMIEKGKNIPSVINGLFRNKKLLEAKIVKNWDN